MLQFDFQPSATQATITDRAMQTSLADSLDYLISIDDVALAAQTRKHLQNWTPALHKDGRARPATFGAYYDLVEALQADDGESAERFAKEILSDTCHSADFQILRLKDDYHEHQIQRFKRFMGNGKTDASGIAAASDEDSKRFGDAILEALAWLDANVPSLSSEMRRLISDIVLVAPDGSSANAFEGGTCFKLWGALFLNAESDFTLPELVTTLAHEEGHAVLFGACRESMLVNNPDEELFWSPIRQSERPLEGIFHATFVSARMIWILSKLSEASSLSAKDRAHAEKISLETQPIYREGVEIVRKNADFTPIGHAVFEAMQEHTRPQLALV